jgi:hypothetical protein
MHTAGGIIIALLCCLNRQISDQMAWWVDTEDLLKRVILEVRYSQYM